MTESTLSNTQRRVLEDTSNLPENPAEKFVGHLPAGARQNVISALVKKGLLKKRGDGHFITQTGFAAVGKEPPATEKPTEEKQPRISKQDTMLSMLKEGTTIPHIMKATGWQKHSVHGAMANLKKKLKLNIATSKTDDADRVYKIA
jgi:hypothetical protein